MTLQLIWNVLISAPILLLAFFLVVRWLKSCGLPLGRVPDSILAPKDGRGEATTREIVTVFGSTLLFRAAIFLIVSLAGVLLLGKTDGQGILSLWEKWDGFHYVRLVEQGYGGYAENGQHYFLVFYPLYVWITRLVKLLVGNTLASGLLVSALCYSGGCVYLYRLAVLEYGRAVAARAVLFLSVFPFAFFFGGMMTEGLFLLTTAAGLYHIRRHQWLIAGLWGILAAMTRLHGLLLIGAALAELIEDAHPFALEGEARTRSIKSILCRLPVLLLPLLGTLVYLGLNYAVDGNAFAFTGHQVARWGQGFMWISQVLGYLLTCTFSYPNLAVQLQMWLPELLLFPLFFALLWHERGQHRSMIVLYAFACLFLDYSLSSLLSAGRYLSCAIPFFFFMARLTERRPKLTAALTVFMSAFFVVALTLYVTGGQIM